MSLKATSTAANETRPTFSLDTLLYAVMLFSWVTVWRVQDLFPVLASIKFPILVQLSVLALYFSDHSPLRRYSAIQSPLLKVLLIFLAVMIIGIPFSLWPINSFMFLLKDIFPTFLLMIVLATSVREASDLEWFSFAFLIGGLIYAIIVFLYHPVGPSGRLEELVYYDANDFAMLMVCSIPFAVFFLRPSVVFWKRIIALITLGMFIIMIIRSGSRGGFLGLIAVMGYILLRYRAVPARLRIGAAVGGILLLFVAGSSNYWEMMGTLLNPKDDYNMTGDVGRKAVWLRGLGYMAARPILGVGIRAFPIAEGELSPLAKQYAEMGRGIKWSVAHNSFVEIGAECGVIGLVLFVLLLGVAIRTLSKVQNKTRGSPHISQHDAAFAQMLIAALIGYILCGFFISAEYFAYLYVLFGLLLGQQAILKRRSTTNSSHPTPSTVAKQQTRHTQPVHWTPTGS